MTSNTFLAQHGVILPIVLPLLSGAGLVLVERWRPRWAAPVSLLSVLLLLALTMGLAWRAGSGEVSAYLLSNWRAPFGIALALDRLSALMLLLTAVVAMAAVLHSVGGDDRRGAHFHSLFQFQLMGLNGAFLTADLFNLFVFFEVLLAASYGLMLHGHGAGQRQRLKVAVHAVIFNLTGSALFLVAVSLLYAVTGTLNMADLALRFAQVAPQDQRLAQAAALMLLVVFAVKAALLPLYFWLPNAYAATTTAVAVLFVILTKVGVYAIARTTTLIFGVEIAAPALPLLAGATLALAALGVLAAQRLRGMAGYLIVGSAGTLLLALGLSGVGMLAAALFYLANSSLVVALFILAVERLGSLRLGTDRGSDVIAALPLQRQGQGVALVGAMFVVAAVGAAGLPPLAGFLGKAMLLDAAGHTAWARPVVIVVLLSSLALMVALARAGSAVFWQPLRGSGPASQHAAANAAGATASAGPAMAMGWLLAAVLACSLFAGPLSAYTHAAAVQLVERQSYIRAVLGAQPAALAFDVRREMRERGELK